jgi:hypothetical protein
MRGAVISTERPPTEIEMRRAAFAILGALLIAGSTVQAATAEYHHVRKARVAPIAGGQQFRNANS